MTARAQLGPSWLVGFTLLELLVAVTIMAILSAILSVAVLRVKKKARITGAAATIYQLRSAMALYAEDWGTYPPDDGDSFDSSVRLLCALLSERREGPYAGLKPHMYDDNNGVVASNKGILDPWNNVYRYHWSTQTPAVVGVGQSKSSRNLTYNLWSVGPDGENAERVENPYYPEPDPDHRYGDDIVSW